MFQGQILGDHAALGNAQHAGGPDSQFPHGVRQIFCHILNGKAFRDIIPPVKQIYLILVSEDPVHAGNGQSGPFDPPQAQARHENQGDIPVSKFDIVGAYAADCQFFLFCLTSHRRASFSHMLPGSCSMNRPGCIPSDSIINGIDSCKTNPINKMPPAGNRLAAQIIANNASAKLSLRKQQSYYACSSARVMVVISHTSAGP